VRLGYAPALALLTAAAGVLRFATLDGQSFDGDELFTAWLADGSMSSMLSALPATESTPPLYQLVAWAWAKAFGANEVGLRSLSALFGTLTVPVAAAAASKLGSRGAGLVAAALVAVSPLLVWLSQQARANALLVLLGALSFLFFVRALEAPAPARLACWALASVLALATHYFAVFLVVPEAVWLLRATAARRRVVLACAAPAAAACALAPLAYAQRGNPGGLEDADLAVRIAQVPKAFLVGFALPLEAALTVASAALLALAVWGLARAGVRERRPALVALAIAACAVAVPVALAFLDADFVVARHFVAAFVPAAVAFAIGFAAWRVGMAAAAGLCALSLAIVVSVAVDDRLQRTDLRGAAEALEPAARDRAIVVTPPLPLQWDFSRKAVLARRGAFEVYFPDARQVSLPGAAVTEVDVVGLASEGRFEIGSPRPPRPSRVSPPPGFDLYARHSTETFTILRFRAARARVVPPGELAALALDPRAVPDLWLQPGRR
jgi:mannosyltransferase